MQSLIRSSPLGALLLPHDRKWQTKPAVWLGRMRPEPRVLLGTLQAHTAMGAERVAGFDAEYSGTTACMALLTQVRASPERVWDLALPQTPADKHGPCSTPCPVAFPMHAPVVLVREGMLCSGLPQGHLITGNVGDSRAMLARRGPDGRMQGIELTRDAKPNDPQVWLVSPLHGACSLSQQGARSGLCMLPRAAPSRARHWSASSPKTRAPPACRARDAPQGFHDALVFLGRPKMPEYAGRRRLGAGAAAHREGGRPGVAHAQRRGALCGPAPRVRPRRHLPGPGHEPLAGRPARAQPGRRPAADLRLPPPGAAGRVRGAGTCLANPKPSMQDEFVVRRARQCARMARAWRVSPSASVTKPRRSPAIAAAERSLIPTWLGGRHVGYGP